LTSLNNLPLFKPLKSKKKISSLFDFGKKTTSPIITLYYLNGPLDNNTFYFGVSVSKKIIKSAVTRNYIKRLLRLALRSSFYNSPKKFYNISCVVLIYTSPSPTNLNTLSKSITSLVPND
tara:strand:+ start:2610 stop:2969 length:360 start_codon:yes stop_codon:yes gene_type:complete